MHKSYRFKMFRSKRLRRLHQIISRAGQIWNHSVALHRRYYRMFGKTLPKDRLQKHLAKLRNRRYAHWQEVGSQSVQAVTDRLYRAWDAYFKKEIKRPPTFKKSRRYSSFTLKQAGYKLIGHGRVRILGKAYRFNQSRPILGNVKTLTVRRDTLGDIYLSFSCEDVPCDEQSTPKTGLAAGHDFGLKHFLTIWVTDTGTSTDGYGRTVNAPQPLKAALKELRTASRKHSRKSGGSHGREKARLEVARTHRRIANVRDDWQWKLARGLSEEFDHLVFEDLNIAAMKELWGRKISDLGFADFFKKVRWMTDKLGKKFWKINRWEPTTTPCNRCAHKQDMPLNVRVFVCARCGHTDDRDFNASKNISEAGRRLWSKATSQTSQEAGSAGVSTPIIAESLAL